MGSGDKIAEVEWISLQTQQTENSLTAGEPRSAECTHNVAFDVMGACTPGAVGQLVKIMPNSGETKTRLVPGYCVIMGASSSHLYMSNISDKPPATGFQCFNGGTRQGVRSCRCVPEWEGNRLAKPDK